MIYRGTDRDAEWLALVKAYKRTAFRLEQAPAYLADIRSGALDSWLAGATAPPSANPWTEMVAAKAAAGARMERVRVYCDPPTPYQEWNRWASAANVAAGEVQHYISWADAVDAGLVDAGDWWLLDDELLVVFHFEGLERVAVEVVEDAARLIDARQWWQVAVQLARAAGA